LIDLLGKDYLEAVCNAAAALSGRDADTLRALVAEKVDFYPEEFQRRADQLVEQVGGQLCPPVERSSAGAGTLAFHKASHPAMAPLAALGPVRVGEDGMARLISKSEHYHASLGHSFPGYRLVNHARELGIPNATHNNTRGHITRLLERELVRAAHGLAREDEAGLQRVIDSQEAHVLNRVINLETGSLAVEAGFKMMLARFYRLEDTFEPPRYAGRIPVFLVMADRQGGKKANYHGTTVFTQFLRGMWPELYQRLEEAGIFIARPAAINDSDHFRRLVEEYDRPPYKVAGFFHEIVLMNYGGIRLEKEFLQQAYALCHEHDIPIMDDEIQSCIWSEQFFLFREYGLQPDFVAIGKGFPGGEYPASRILTTAPLDTLNQFGALVTNGQEELAALAYLVTMAFVEQNGSYIAALGDAYFERLRELARRHPTLVSEIQGYRHLASLFFRETDKAVRFCKLLNEQGIDISAQTYKADCPPAALTKIPLTLSYRGVDFLVERMEEALAQLENS
jgi:acetylornithine/succinyldiaminopimelate/putrescine aminotransferase